MRESKGQPYGQSYRSLDSETTQSSIGAESAARPEIGGECPISRA